MAVTIAPAFTKPPGWVAVGAFVAPEVAAAAAAVIGGEATALGGYVGIYVPAHLGKAAASVLAKAIAAAEVAALPVAA